MVKIPEEYASLLEWKTKALANLALVMKDGTPQVTPLWFDFDGTHIIINTARGRVKDRILHRHPYVALSIQAPNEPYRYLQVRGRVVDESEEGAYEVICRLNLKYQNDPVFPRRPGEVRVTYKILPEHARGG